MFFVVQVVLVLTLQATLILMTSENSCYILTCPAKLLLEKAVKQSVTQNCVIFRFHIENWPLELSGRTMRREKSCGLQD